jgi:hypothetical protein
MKNLFSFLLLTVVFATSSFGQKYFTKTGKIFFDATATNSPEKITGVNRGVTCVVDIKNGNIQFAALMKSFEFERALMQEHFNENYIESEKYPKAEFKGIISDNAAVDYLKDGTYTVKVKGKLTMHGETKDIETTGKIIIQGGKINTAADFIVEVADFKVSIPGLVADKVSKTVKIIVNCSLEPLKS